MSKTVFSCLMILGLCVVAAPVSAGEDETFMDWSYASGLEPKQRPSQEIQETVVGETTPDAVMGEEFDAGVFATSEVGALDEDTMANMNEYNTSRQYTNTTYTMAHNATAQGNNVIASGVSFEGGQDAVGVNNAMAQNVIGTGMATSQTVVVPQYYQVPMSTMQTPAEVHHINNPIKVQYPITKQYPISMQYPVTIQKEITVQRPVVVQQPIVVQRPIVMQQPVMVQHKPLMVKNQPVMVQQQPTVVQKQPIVVNAPAPMALQKPCMGQSMTPNVAFGMGQNGIPNMVPGIEKKTCPMARMSNGIPVTGTFTGTAMMPMCPNCIPTGY